MGSGSKSSPHQMPEATQLTTQGPPHHIFKPLTWRHLKICERVCVWAFVCVVLYFFSLVKDAKDNNVRLSFGSMCLCGRLSCNVLVNLCFLPWFGGLGTKQGSTEIFEKNSGKAAILLYNTGYC